MYRYSNLFLVFAISVFFGAVCADRPEISNVVTCYKLDRATGDSVLVGRVHFDALPQYLKAVRVSVEHYVRGDFTDGMQITFSRTVGQQFQIEPFKVKFDGPLNFGDTIRAEFLVTPLHVGFIPLVFLAMDDFLPGETVRRRVSGGMRTQFILGPDGETQSLASPSTKSENATTLGPSSDLLYRYGRTFWRHPKPDPNDPIAVRSWQTSIRSSRPLSLQVFCQPQVSGSSTLDINVTAYPNSDFPEGMGIILRHDSSTAVEELSPSVTAPLSSSMTYDLHAAVSFMESGVHRFGISFNVCNKDYELLDSGLVRNNSPLLEEGMGFCVGVNESGAISFITDLPRLVDPSSAGLIDSKWDGIDSRYRQFAGKLIRTGRSIEIKGEGYDMVVAPALEKEEAINEARRRQKLREKRGD